MAAIGDMSGCSNSITPFGLTAASQVSSFLLHSVRDQSFKKQKYFWCLPFLFKIFVIKILTDGFGDTSFLIRILRQIFKSLLITQQSWREEAGFGMSSCFFFSAEDNSGFSKKGGKGNPFLCTIGQSTLLGLQRLGLLVSTFLFLASDCLQSECRTNKKEM